MNDELQNKLMNLCLISMCIAMWALTYACLKM